MILTKESSLRERFGACLDSGEEKQDLVSMRHVFHEPQLTLFLAQFATYIAAPSLVVAASMFSKFYARACCLPLYFASMHNHAVAVRIEDINLRITNAKDMCFYFLKLEKLDGSANRIELLNNLCLYNWQHVIKCLELSTGVNNQVLWENFFVYVHYYYKEWLVSSRISLAQQERLRLDYELIAKYFSDKIINYLPKSDESNDCVRRTCCYRYQLPLGDNCSTCPRNR